MDGSRLAIYQIQSSECCPALFRLGTLFVYAIAMDPSLFYYMGSPLVYTLYILSIISDICFVVVVVVLSFILAVFALFFFICSLFWSFVVPSVLLFFLPIVHQTTWFRDWQPPRID